MRTLRRHGRRIGVAVACVLLVAGAVGVSIPVGRQSVDHVLVLDLSVSVAADARRIVRAAGRRLQDMGPGGRDDRVAILGFGETAVMLVPLRPVADLEAAMIAAESAVAGLDIMSRRGSDLGSALALAGSLAEPGRSLRIRVLGDGRWARSPVESALADLERRGVAVAFEGPPVAPDPDVRIAIVGPAPRLVPGEQGTVTARVMGTFEAPRIVRIELGGESFSVTLRPGRAEHVSATVLPASGARHLRIGVVDAGGPDAFPWNDGIDLPVEPDGVRSIGLVGTAAERLRPLLEGAGLRVSILSGETAPPPDLDAYVLADQPAEGAFPAAWTAVLTKAVTVHGAGLVVLGGPHSFRAGGYGGWKLDSLLPLSSRPPRGRDVHVLLDHSGSMEHGDRLGRAVLAVRTLAEGLPPDDRLQVWPFASSTDTPIPASPVRPGRFLDVAMPQLSRLVPGGGTRVIEALRAPISAVAASGADRDPVLLLVSDMKDPRLDDPVVAHSLRKQLASVRGVVVVLLLDPAADTEGRVNALGARLLPVRDLVPGVLLESLASEGWRREPVVTRWTSRPPGLPSAGTLRALNPVVAGGDSRILLETVGGEPVLGAARRGAGRVRALGTSALLEGWTRDLVGPLVRGVLPPDGRAWACAVREGRLEVRVPMDSAPSALVASINGSESRLREVAPGRWSGELPTGATAGPVLLHEGDGKVVARPALVLPDDAEHLLMPRRWSGVRAMASPPASRLRWPWALLALGVLGWLAVSRGSSRVRG